MVENIGRSFFTSMNLIAKSKPSDEKTLVVFVLGGIAPDEVREKEGEKGIRTKERKSARRGEKDGGEITIIKEVGVGLDEKESKEKPNAINLPAR